MPIEIANSDKILVEDMDTTFYIVINDEEIQENVVQLEMTFFNEYDNKIIIPYNWENIVEIPFHIPSISKAISKSIPIAIKWFYEQDQQIWFKDWKALTKKILAYYFNYSTEFNLYKKYPSSILPSRIADKYNEELSKSDSKDYDIGVSVKIPNHPTSSFSFIGREEIRSNDELATRINKEKEAFKEYIDSNLNSNTCENTYDIIQDQTTSSDPYIENIFYSIWCGYQCNHDYQCTAKIIAKHKTDTYFKEEKDKTKFYSFQISLDDTVYSDDDNRSKAKEQWKKFISEAELFAKNIVLDTPKNMEYKEPSYQSFSAWKNIKNTKYDHNYKNETHSSVYNQIMEWEKPQIKKIEKHSNIAKRKFTIKLKSGIKKTIRNTGTIDADPQYASVGVMVDIQWKAYDKKGNEIKDISDEELFKDVRLVCLVDGDNPQIWFRQWTDIVSRKDSNIDSHSMSCDVVSKGPRHYKWSYKPYEYVNIYVASQNRMISNFVYYLIKVKDMTPEIELDKNPLKIQDSADSVFKFQIKSEIHKKVQCKIKIPYGRYAKYHIPTIKISQQWSWDENLKHYLSFTCETNKEIPIRISPPNMSNFDVLGELNKLSMVALQEGTATTFLGDLVGVKVENHLNKLKKAKETLQNVYRKWYKNVRVMQKVTKLDKAYKTLNKANDVAGYTQDAMKVGLGKSNVEWHISDTNEAFIKENKKWTVEKVADVGIWWINILQSTVGAVMMAPKYIPIIGKSGAGEFITKKIGAKFILAFNLMTNVWKWNLQYISKSEKIDRAKEKKLPIPIIIGVETQEGFLTQNIQIINVLYTWLDN